jgi:hypothetical protein
MPGRNQQGKPDSDNYQNMHEFPKYAGAGYMLTPDVVSYIGRPGLPMLCVALFCLCYFSTIFHALFALALTY